MRSKQLLRLPGVNPMRCKQFVHHVRILYVLFRGGLLYMDGSADIKNTALIFTPFLLLLVQLLP